MGRWIASLLLSATLGACHPPSAVRRAPVAPAPRPTEPLTLAASPAPPPPPEPAPVAAPAAYFVGACNVERVGGGALDRGTYVAAFVDGDEPLFPPPPPSGAYRCGGMVHLGQEVTLEATTSGAFEFVRWRKSNLAKYRSDYCPCAGSTEPVCRFVVDEEAIAGHPRAYCGAVWRAADRGAQAVAY